MKNIHTKAIAVVFGLLSFGAQAASSLTFQGVTFASQAIDADTLEFSILNSNHATGDWSGASFLKAFEIKGLGTEVLSGKLISGPGVTAPSLGSVTDWVAAKLGCTTGGTKGACFSFATPLALTSNMTWRIDFTAAAAPLVFDTPHIKVQFLDSLGDMLGGGARRSRASVGEQLIKSAASSIGREVGRQIIRGVLGSILGGSKR